MINVLLDVLVIINSFGVVFGNIELQQFASLAIAVVLLSKYIVKLIERILP